MGRYSVNALPLAEVPHLASVVPTASCYVVSAVGEESGHYVENGHYELPSKLHQFPPYPFGEKLIP